MCLYVTTDVKSFNYLIWDGPYICMLPQMSHLNGFSPVGIKSWPLRWWGWTSVAAVLFLSVAAEICSADMRGQLLSHFGENFWKKLKIFTKKGGNLKLYECDKMNKIK